MVNMYTTRSQVVRGIFDFFFSKMVDLRLNGSGTRYPSSITERERSGPPMVEAIDESMNLRTDFLPHGKISLSVLPNNNCAKC